MIVRDELAATIDLAAAVQLLIETSGIDADDDATPAVASLVGREPAALRWAGTLARTIGWRPLERRLSSWELLPSVVGDAGLPWQGEIERVVDSVSSAAASLLPTLAACDAPFAWDVLDGVAPGASVESLCALEDVGLLERRTRAGVVTFAVRYCARSVVRLRDPEGAQATSIRWLEAWVERARRSCRGRATA